MRIPNRSHCRLLPLISNCSSIEYSLENRLMKLVCSLLNSNSHLVKCLANRCRFQSISSMGANMSYIVNNVHTTVVRDQCVFKGIFIDKDDVSEIEEANAALCVELMDIRDGLKYIDGLSLQECRDIITYICTS